MVGASLCSGVASSSFETHNTLIGTPAATRAIATRLRDTDVAAYTKDDWAMLSGLVAADPSEQISFADARRHRGLDEERLRHAVDEPRQPEHDRGRDEQPDRQGGADRRWLHLLTQQIQSATVQLVAELAHADLTVRELVALDRVPKVGLVEVAHQLRRNVLAGVDQAPPGPLRVHVAGDARVGHAAAVAGN